MFDVLKSSHQDDSNTWSNIGFGVDISQIESTEVNFAHLKWYSDNERKTIQ